MGIYIFPKLNNFLNLSGGTVTGNTVFTGNLTATTFYSGSTPLETIIQNISLLNSGRTYSFSAGTNLGVLTSSTSPNVVYYLNDDINLNSFSAMSSFISILNAGDANLNTLSVTGSSVFTAGLLANTFSASTINSGSTNLYSIFAPIGDYALQSQLSFNTNGLNTYTGGTASAQSINISGLTIESLFASGSSVFTGGLSANTFSANTLFSGTTELSTLIPLGVWTSTTGNNSFKIKTWSGDSSSPYTLLASRNSIIENNAYGSIIIGGQNHIIHAIGGLESQLSSIVGGGRNRINHSQYGGIFAGSLNTLGNNDDNDFLNLYQTNSVIVGGRLNKIFRGYSSIILGGGSNLITGDTYSGDYGVYASSVLGGRNNIIKGAWYSSIVGGSYNLLTHDAFRSVIIGGSNITGNSPNMVYVPNLNINNLANPTATTNNILFADSQGFVYKKTISGGTGIQIDNQVSAITISYTGITSSGGGSSIQNGLNTYTGGTFSAQTVNVSALTINTLSASGSSVFTGGLSANTFSASTINSGSTDLYSIFAPIGNYALQSQLSYNVNGLNTYTGGTALAQSINISGLTIESLFASGFTTLNSTTASTLNVRSLSGGGTLMVVTDNNGLLSTQSIPSAGQSTSVQNGLNTYTGGTASAQSINISALTINTLLASGSSVFTGGLSANTFSASTINSGSTDLYSIFAPIGNYALQSQLSYNVNGLNTYTGGTASAQSINISALTISTLLASGSSVFTGGLSANTFSASTINSGSTDLYSIFASNFANILPGGGHVINNKTGSTFKIKSIYGGGSTYVTENAAFIQISTTIPSGAGLWEPGVSSAYSIQQTIGNSYASGNYNLVFGKNSYVLSYCNYSTLLGNNSTIKNSSGTTIIGGNSNYIGGFIRDSSVYLNQNSGILAGQGNKIYTSINSAIISGFGNRISNKSETYFNYSSIITGKYNIVSSNYCSITNGKNNTIYNNSFSSIINGTGNTINTTAEKGRNNTIINGRNNLISDSSFTTIIGCVGLTLNSYSDSVIVPQLFIKTINTVSQPTHILSINNTTGLVSKTVPNVIINGLNTYTGGSTSILSINVSGGTFAQSSFSASTGYALIVSGGTLITSGITANTLTAGSISGTSLSGTNIFSGSTNLSSIFHNKSGYLLQKNGLVSGSTFAGSPLISSVIFGNSFSANNYVVVITGEDARMWSISSKSVTGFTINSNSSVAIAGNVFWMASENGEGYR